MCHAGISQADLLDKLRQQWPSGFQDFGCWVDAKHLWRHQALDKNLNKVLLGYALKPELTYGIPRFPDVRLAAEYWLSLAGRGGLKRIITVMPPVIGSAAPVYCGSI